MIRKMESRLKLFQIFLKYIFLFVLGGIAYIEIEILWRGRSHFSMFILGGMIFLYAGIQNGFESWDKPLWLQILQVESIILLSEFVTECIVNLWLGLNVWDYSSLPLNFKGQICLPYALLFLPLALVAIILDDYVRYVFFNEDKPHYIL